MNKFIEHLKEAQNSKDFQIAQYRHFDYQKYINEAERLIKKIKDGMSPKHQIISSFYFNIGPRIELAEIDCNNNAIPSVNETINTSHTRLPI